MKDKQMSVSYKKSPATHPVAGEAPSIPEFEKPVVSAEARHPASNDSRPSAGTTNPHHKGIPADGTLQLQRGHEYPEVQVENAKNDERVVRKCIENQVASSSPTAEMVKDSQRSKSGN